MRAFAFADQMMFRMKVSTTKTSAKIGVSLASFASQVLALPLDRKLSAPPEMAPERPALYGKAGKKLENGENDLKSRHVFQSFRVLLFYSMREYNIGPYTIQVFFRPFAQF